MWSGKKGPFREVVGPSVFVMIHVNISTSLFLQTHCVNLNQTLGEMLVQSCFKDCFQLDYACGLAQTTKTSKLFFAEWFFFLLRILCWVNWLLGFYAVINHYCIPFHLYNLAIYILFYFPIFDKTMFLWEYESFYWTQNCWSHSFTFNVNCNFRAWCITITLSQWICPITRPGSFFPNLILKESSRRKLQDCLD